MILSSALVRHEHDSVMLEHDSDGVHDPTHVQFSNFTIRSVTYTYMYMVNVHMYVYLERTHYLILAQFLGSMAEMMQWSASVHPGSQPNPPGMLMPSSPRRRGGGNGSGGGSRTTPPKHQHPSPESSSAAAAAHGSTLASSPAADRGSNPSPTNTNTTSSSSSKTLDASKIIYCPFSEEVKQQRYQQDPNQNFVCPVCGQMFPSFNYLANHMVNHLPSETVTKGPGEGNKIHICKVCNKSFSRSDMLTRHMRLHTGLRPYECRICGQVFSRSDHLHTHNRTHTGEKPYRCPHCPYAAPRRDMITRHMRIHQKQWPKRGRRSSSTGSSDTAPSSSFSSSQESSSADSAEVARRQSHSLSSMDSLETSGCASGSGGAAAGGVGTLEHAPLPQTRVSLSVLEHHHAQAQTQHIDVETVFARPRQWSSESYEASDERTPSTPGSAKRFFTHQWHQHAAAAATATAATAATATSRDRERDRDVTGVCDSPTPSSPKKRQWSAMSGDHMDMGQQGDFAGHDDLDDPTGHDCDDDMIGVRVTSARDTHDRSDDAGDDDDEVTSARLLRQRQQLLVKYSTESTDTERTLESVSSTISEASQTSEINVESLLPRRTQTENESDLTGKRETTGVHKVKAEDIGDV